MDRVNAAIDGIGYPDTGYQMWVQEGEDGSVSQIVIEGYWPGQAAYGLIHEHELYKAATLEAEAQLKALERVSYNRFKKME
ncbi:MAG: hypothetical protein KDD06_06675 [Phaeodactylibacter sp.]|nr:hypothetical protein [Phaeodactylibacter sp.]MCB9285777.1 hypothetical protein [Lewinellaceae bacterium]